LYQVFQARARRDDVEKGRKVTTIISICKTEQFDDMGEFSDDEEESVQMGFHILHRFADYFDRRSNYQIFSGSVVHRQSRDNLVSMCIFVIYEKLSGSTEDIPAKRTTNRRHRNF
jgi:hypothetical protein